jgi:salicylate hydroxylase
LLNFVGVIKRDDWLIESWSEAGTVPECLRDFAGWHEDVLTLVNAVDIPYKWALLSRQPLPRWTVGRVSLLGDACHPTLPFLAQGANMLWKTP